MKSWYGLAAVFFLLVAFSGCTPKSTAAGQASATGAATAAQSSAVTPSTGASPAAAADIVDAMQEALQQYDGLSFDFTLTDSNGNQLTGTEWRQAGSGIKILLGGGEDAWSVNIINQADQTMASYDNSNTGLISQNIYAGMDKTTVQQMVYENMSMILPWNYFASLDAQQAQLLADDTLDGTLCHVLQVEASDYAAMAAYGIVADETAGLDFGIAAYSSQDPTLTQDTIWLDAGTNIPLKVVRTESREDAEIKQVEITGIQFGQLSADTFAVPSGVRLLDAGGLQNAQASVSGSAQQ